MITKFIPCRLALALGTTCQSTQSTVGTNRQTMQQRLLAQNSTNPNAIGEPMPPAEGPEDIPAEAPLDVNRNPALVLSPLLRANAAAGL
ncbi:hypothetical protein BH20VER1_BH20VER1_09640 [soil metagenome]